MSTNTKFNLQQALNNRGFFISNEESPSKVNIESTKFNPKVLEGVNGLSIVEFDDWKQKQLDAGKIDENTSDTHLDRLYRNQQYAAKYGIESFKSLTPAEKEAYELQKQREYESRIQRYEVVSVHKYTKNITNKFGGIIGTEVCYSFTYVGGDQLYSVDDFRHLEYGLTKVTIGDSDLYIVNNNGETTRTLQLTKETLANIKGLN
jgi:hypothetical protein